MSRSAFRSATLALGLAGALVLGLVPAALGHTVDFPVEVSLGARPTQTSAGETVVFKGNVTSRKPACMRRATVKLKRLGEGVIATTTTGHRGRYRFEEPVEETGLFRVVVARRVLSAVHPHLHTCSARSDVVRVVVV